MVIMDVLGPCKKRSEKVTQSLALTSQIPACFLGTAAIQLGTIANHGEDEARSPTSDFTHIDGSLGYVEIVLLLLRAAAVFCLTMYTACQRIIIISVYTFTYTCRMKGYGTAYGLSQRATDAYKAIHQCQFNCSRVMSSPRIRTLGF